jgi:hypothetical protein
MDVKEKSSRVTDGGLKQEQIGQLTIGRSVTSDSEIG